MLKVAETSQEVCSEPLAALRTVDYISEIEGARSWIRLLTSGLKKHMEERIQSALKGLSAESGIDPGIKEVLEKAPIGHQDEYTAYVSIDRQSLESNGNMVNLARLERNLARAIGGDRGDLIVKVEVVPYGTNGAPHKDDELCVTFTINPRLTHKPKLIPLRF